MCCEVQPRCPQEDWVLRSVGDKEGNALKVQAAGA